MKHEEKIVSPEAGKFLEDQEMHKVSTHFVLRIVTIVIAALGLISALAWDEALRHLFERIVGETGTLREELAYAILITALAALVSVLLGKYVIKRRDKRD